MIPNNIQQMMSMVNIIKNIQKSFKGDPNQRLNALISSGMVPNDVLERAKTMANPIYEMMKGITR